MLSISLSCLLSKALRASSTTLRAAVPRLMDPLTLLSFSSSFTAYQRFLSADIEAGSCCFTFSIAFSKSAENISAGNSTSFVLAVRIASSISLSRPSPFSADVSMIGQPSTMDSRSVSILISRFSSRSAIFKAITTGTPVSINCVVRYRFRSMLVASTRFTITSGCSFKM